MLKPTQIEDSVAINEIIDIEQLNESLSIMSLDLSQGLELLREAYLKDAEHLLAQLRQAIATLDFTEIRFASHALKSSSALMGAQRLSQLCNQIESQALQQNASGLSVLVAQALFVQSQVAQILLNYEPNSML